MIKAFETENKCIKLLSIMMCVLMLFMITCSFMVQQAHANELIVQGGIYAALGVAAILASLGIVSTNTENINTRFVQPISQALATAHMLSPAGLLTFWTISGRTYIASSIVEFVKNWLAEHNAYNQQMQDTYYSSGTYTTSDFISVSAFCASMSKLTYSSNTAKLFQQLDTLNIYGNYNFAIFNTRYGYNHLYLINHADSVNATNGMVYIYSNSGSFDFIRYDTDDYGTLAINNKGTFKSGFGFTMQTNQAYTFISAGVLGEKDYSYGQVPADGQPAEDVIYDWADHELPVQDAKITLPDNTMVDAIDDAGELITDTLLPQTFEDTIPDALSIPQQIAITGETTSTGVDVKTDTDVNVEQLSGDTTLLGLMETRFPWCIPWDLTASIRALSADAQAPCFTVDLFKDVTWDSLNLKNTSFTIDFSAFAKIALACRWMMTIMFCGNLALITKKMIWS